MKAYKPKVLTFNMEAICHFILKEVKLWKGHVLDNLQEVIFKIFFFFLAQCNFHAVAANSLLRCFLWRKEHSFTLENLVHLAAGPGGIQTCVTCGMK